MTATTYATLAPLVESLKRFVAVPGGFDSFFPDALDSDLVGCLADGFARAQLDGFFISGANARSLDLTAGTISPALSLAEGALVVLYAGKRLVMSQLLNLKTTTKYEAKGLIYDVQQASNVLTTLLKEYNQELDQLVVISRRAGAGTAFVMADAYFIRATGYYAGYASQLADDRAYDYNASSSDPLQIFP